MMPGLDGVGRCPLAVEVGSTWRGRRASSRYWMRAGSGCRGTCGSLIIVRGLLVEIPPVACGLAELAGSLGRLLGVCGDVEFGQEPVHAVFDLIAAGLGVYPGDVDPAFGHGGDRGRVHQGIAAARRWLLVPGLDP